MACDIITNGAPPYAYIVIIHTILTHINRNLHVNIYIYIYTHSQLLRNSFFATIDPARDNHRQNYGWRTLLRRAALVLLVLRNAKEVRKSCGHINKDYKQNIDVSYHLILTCSQSLIRISCIF